MARGGSKKASEVLSQVLKQSGLKSGLQRGRALQLWPEVAGPALLELTEAERLEDGVLFVRTRDSVVNHQLTYLREEFVKRYQERFPGSVRDIRFQVGQLNPKPAPRPAPKPLPRLSLEEESQIRELAGRVPEDLRGVILRAGKALKQRQKDSPHPPCAICGLPRPENPCPSCQKLLAENAVVRESKRLEKFPLRPRLEGDPLSAARYLAQTRLEGQLRELLPQVIQQPELIAILQDTARRYLQLRTGEKQVSTYRNLLPQALQSLLKEV